MRVRQFAEQRHPPGPRPQRPVLLELAPSLLEGTQDSLRVASNGIREAIALWAGRRASDDSASISHLIEPVFESTRDFLTVPPEERKLIAEFVRREALLIFADIHTHPHDAFLSCLDRARSFSLRDGFYAGVVPSFAIGAAGEDWRLYEAQSGEWHEVEFRERVRA